MGAQVSTQMALPLVSLAHSDGHPPEAFADWFARGLVEEVCRSCGDRRTRGRYWEIQDETGTRRSEPMCSRCWLAITHADIRLVESAR